MESGYVSFTGMREVIEPKNGNILHDTEDPYIVYQAAIFTLSETSCRHVAPQECQMTLRSGEKTGALNHLHITPSIVTFRDLYQFLCSLSVFTCGEARRSMDHDSPPRFIFEIQAVGGQMNMALISN